MPELAGHPPAQVLQDRETDVFKLACDLAVLLPGEVATARNARRLDGVLPPAGVKLIGRALSPDQNERPTVKDLFIYLADTVAALTSPPEIDSAGW